MTAEQFLCKTIRETMGRREQELREPAARFCQSIEKKIESSTVEDFLAADVYQNEVGYAKS